MKNAQNQKSMKNQRYYLQYCTENRDKITLSFRDEHGMKNHIEENKIAQNDIIYAGGNRPQRPKYYPLTQKQIKDLEELLYCLRPSLDWD